MEKLFSMILLNIIEFSMINIISKKEKLFQHIEYHITTKI